MFSSGSSYTDNLQPFDRTIASTMSIEKTDPNKVCMISGISPTLQGHPLGRAYSGQIKTRYQCLTDFVSGCIAYFSDSTKVNVLRRITKKEKSKENHIPIT